MESKRILEIFVATKRTFTVRAAGPTDEIMICPHCASPMLLAEQAATVCGVSRRTVYQAIESGAAHFAETVSGAAWVCTASLGSGQ